MCGTEIPKTDEVFLLLIEIIPLQLLAYHIAVIRNCNVDQPKNLTNPNSVEAIQAGGEYPLQDGFGWTNGVLLNFMNRY